MTKPKPFELPEEGLRILVVHHDHQLSEALGETLRRDGHEVDVAASGAIAIMRASVKLPEVVVIDLPAAPAQADARFVAEMRTRFAPAPAIVAMSAVRAKPWTLFGMSVLLLRPFRAATLHRAVTLAARTTETQSPRMGSGLRRIVRATNILVFASVLDSPDLEEAVGDRLCGAQFVVVESEDDALRVLSESTPALLLGPRGSERLSAEAVARGIETHVLED